jgi:MFS family permease
MSTLPGTELLAETLASIGAEGQLNAARGRTLFPGDAGLRQSHAADRLPTRILSGAFALMFTSFGIAYSIPVLFPSLSRSLAVPVWHLPAYFSVAGALYFSIGMLSGSIADVHGARIMAGAGQLCIAGGLALASLSLTEANFAIVYIIGIGLGIGLTYVPVLSAVQALCPHDRLRAAGIVSAGIGIGTLVLPPLTAFLIQFVGWRHTMQVLACLCAAGVVAAAPLGHPANRRAARHQSIALSAFRTRSFTLNYLAQTLISLVAFVPFAHLVLLAQTRGWSTATGVTLVTCVGVGSTMGRLFLGLVGRRTTACRMGAACTTAMAVSLLALAESRQLWALWADAVLFGCGYGGITALIGPMAAETTRTNIVGRAVGLLMTARALGMLFGPWAVGVGVLWSGHYVMPLVVCAALAGAAAAMLRFMPSAD